MVNIGIVGCGYWGINYVRVFNEMPQSKVVIVCDKEEARLRAVRERFSFTATTADVHEMLANKWLDAVVVSTTAATHFEVARLCLEAGKHVLVEKPICDSVKDGQTLTDLAARQQRVLMVGHTFLFNAGILKMKELIGREEFGRIYYLHATRTNMGPIRSDVNAIWDLAAHDVAIFNFLMEALPSWVSAVGSKPLGKDMQDVSFASLCYPEGVIANIHVSWLDPNKVREIVAVGSHSRVVFDDLNNMERVRIYEKGVAPASQEADSFGEFRMLVRDGDIRSPRVEPSEPLKSQCQHFLDCIEKQHSPRSGGAEGIGVVRVLEAIDRSMQQNGQPVSLS